MKTNLQPAFGEARPSNIINFAYYLERERVNAARSDIFERLEIILQECKIQNLADLTPAKQTSLLKKAARTKAMLALGRPEVISAIAAETARLKRPAGPRAVELILKELAPDAFDLRIG